MDSDSDDEFSVFSMDASTMANVVEDEGPTDVEILQQAEVAIIETNASAIEDLLTQTSSVHSTLNMALLLCKGNYADVLRLDEVKSLLQRLNTADSRVNCGTSAHSCSWISHALEEVFTSEKNSISIIYTTLFAGISFLNLYVQLNYTGPAIEDEKLSDLNELCRVLLPKKDSEVSKSALHTNAIVSLQVDGESPFSICEHPYYLELSRCLLHFLGMQSFVNWSHSESINNITKFTPMDLYTRQPRTLNGFQRPIATPITVATRSLVTASWWCARALIAHQRLLITKEASNTLWTETQYCFSYVLQNFHPTNCSNAYLPARAQLEWGLAQHFFEVKNKGRADYSRALQTTGLQVQLSGSMGKRTKFQVKEVAQMVLFAKSRIENKQKSSESAAATAQTTHVDFGGLKKDEESEPSDELSAEEKLIADGEAAYRTITRDQADPDNILLENIAFTEAIENSNLQVIDQTILLALCLDVKNSNANDGLTREQMMPYLTRVLDNPNNWMVYSTGLLERAWLECETMRSRERAVLQMQALVDQHTTRLTITQTSLKMIEDAAPAHERMEYIYSLVFPPRYALKRDLAERYLGLGVYASALEIFKELEMWDEIVQCHQLLDQPKRAEALIRQRLEVAPTPFMWCSLGDITEDIAHYETSWNLSQGRFARAKRSWARKLYEKGDTNGAITHLIDATKVQPMFTQAWFFLGSLAMRTNQWTIAFEAFTHVVQLSPDDGEAWGNIGSIHLRLKNYGQAFSAFQEALKQKRSMWQMWENFLLCAMEVQRYGDAIYAMHQLLDLREKHKRPVDHEILAWLVQAIVYPEATENADDEEDQETTDASKVNVSSMAVLDDDDDDTILTITPPVSEFNYKKQLAKLLGRITSVVTNNPKLWQVYAHYHDGCGHPQKALECRLKECRALQKAGWETNEQDVVLLCKAALRLANDYIKEGSKTSLHDCRMYLRSLLKKAQLDFAHLPEVKQVEDILHQIDA